MVLSNVRRLAVCVALVAGFAHAVSAADILIADAKSQPESLTVAPGGVLIVGSASTPFVYKVRSGSTTAEKFVDASAEGAGTFFFGMLADAASNTLWTCQLTPVPGKTPVQRRTALRGFNLETGAPKIRWNLPGDNSTCTSVCTAMAHKNPSSSRAERRHDLILILAASRKRGVPFVQPLLRLPGDPLGFLAELKRFLPFEQPAVDSGSMLIRPSRP